MPQREYLGGLAFDLPPQQIAFPPPTTASPVASPEGAFAISPPNQAMAQIEGLTDSYLDTKGLVEKYALEMERQGIDVTRPDPSQPGGGTPFKTFQKMATNLMSLANDLKIRRETQQALIPQIASGNVRGIHGADLTAANAERQFYSTRLLPEVEQMNRILGDSSYTQADWERRDTEAKALKARLREEMNREGITPAEREYLQFNIDALQQKPRETHPYYFRPPAADKAAKKTPLEIAYAKKVTNAVRGQWGQDFEVDIDPETISPVIRNKGLSGVMYGKYPYTDERGNQKQLDMYIDALVKDVEGRTWLSFKRAPTGEEIPPIDVTGIPASQIATNLMTFNPKHGDASKLYAAIHDLELASESGELDEALVLATDLDAPDPKGYEKEIVKEREKIRQDLAKIREDSKFGVTNWVRKEYKVTLPDGRELSFTPQRKGKNKWYLDGNSDLLSFNFTNKQTGEASDKPDDLTPEDIERILAREGYFKKFLPEEPEEVEASTALDMPVIQEGESDLDFAKRMIEYKRSLKK